MLVTFVAKARKDIYNVVNGKKKKVVSKGKSYYWIKANFKDKKAFKNEPTERDKQSYLTGKRGKELDLYLLECEISDLVSEVKNIDILIDIKNYLNNNK